MAVARAALAVRSRSGQERRPPAGGARHRVESDRCPRNYDLDQRRIADSGTGQRMQGVGIMFIGRRFQSRTERLNKLFRLYMAKGAT